MSTRRPRSRARTSAPSYDPALSPGAYAAPAYAAPPPADPWREEDEREALSRRYGHLDLDRGVFDAYAVATRPTEGMSTGAKLGLAAAGAAALGALAWWLRPEAGAAGGVQKTAGGVGAAFGSVSAHPVHPVSTHMAVAKGFAEGFAMVQDGHMVLLGEGAKQWPAGHMFQLNADGTYLDLGLRSVAPSPLKAGS